MTTFQGVRPSLFSFNTSGQPGGYADFDHYITEEPRARGIEREIPMGKIHRADQRRGRQFPVRR